MEVVGRQKLAYREYSNDFRCKEVLGIQPIDDARCILFLAGSSYDVIATMYRFDKDSGTLSSTGQRLVLGEISDKDITPSDLSSVLCNGYTVVSFGSKSLNSWKQVVLKADDMILSITDSQDVSGSSSQSGSSNTLTLLGDRIVNIATQDYEDCFAISVFRVSASGKITYINKRVVTDIKHATYYSNVQSIAIDGERLMIIGCCGIYVTARICTVKENEPPLLSKEVPLDRAYEYSGVAQFAPGIFVVVYCVETYDRYLYMNVIKVSESDNSIQVLKKTKIVPEASAGTYCDIMSIGADKFVVRNGHARYFTISIDAKDWSCEAVEPTWSVDSLSYNDRCSYAEMKLLPGTPCLIAPVIEAGSNFTLRTECLSIRTTARMAKNAVSGTTLTTLKPLGSPPGAVLEWDANEPATNRYAVPDRLLAQIKDDTVEEIQQEVTKNADDKTEGTGGAP